MAWVRHGHGMLCVNRPLVACASNFYLQLTFITDETPFHFLKLTKNKCVITCVTFACDSEVVMTSAVDIRFSLAA